MDRFSVEWIASKYQQSKKSTGSSGTYFKVSNNSNTLNKRDGSAISEN